MKNHSQYSARAAGILGFSIYGSRKCFALDEDLKLDVEKVRALLEKYRGKTDTCVWFYISCLANTLWSVERHRNQVGFCQMAF